MDEQEATEQFEDLVGGPDKGFRMMNLYRNCQMHARGREDGNLHENRTRAEVTEANFRKNAEREGFSRKAIDFYLRHIV